MKPHLVLPLLRTLPRLGLRNLCDIAVHRLCLRVGYYARITPIGGASEATLLPEPMAESSAMLGQPPACDASERAALREELADYRAGFQPFFAFHKTQLGNPPDWFLNPFNGKRAKEGGHWSQGSEFDAELGDIKCVWEASRWNWLIRLVCLGIALGERDGAEALHLADAWSRDWTRRNPSNAGPNWKCGQEASLRLLHLLTAVWLLDRWAKMPAGLGAFLEAHLLRIAATRRYACAQDNNHGTSEAAALFVGGLYLEKQLEAGRKREQARRFKNLGRALLEERIGRLVAPDGSFSQHSLTYHRLFLDSISLTEFFRLSLGEPAFLPQTCERMAAAVRWLHQFLDEKEGDAPNLGPNDGAFFLPLHRQPYRDFRPSVQLGAALFLGCTLYKPGPWDASLRWLGLDPQNFPLESKARPSQLFPSGYLILRTARAWAMLRLSQPNFRASQADALHFDFWLDGQNLLRDGGSYSYSHRTEVGEALKSAAGHNSVRFDGREPMPKLSRFLNADWSRVIGKECHLESQPLIWSGYSEDRQGARLERRVEADDRSWQIIDAVSGFQQEAVWHWRLAPGDWRLEGNRLLGDAIQLEWHADQDCQAEMGECFESRYYLQLATLPQLRLRVRKPTKLCLKIHFTK